MARHDSDSDSVGNGSVGGEGGEGANKRRRRHDSDSDPDPKNADLEGRGVGRDDGRRRRHDSSSSDSAPDSDSKSDDGPTERKKEKAKMSSGHAAGLQKSKDFAIAEREIREKRRDEMKRFDAAGGGGGAVRTVHRDASGKKRDVSSSKDDAEGVRLAEEERTERQRLANRGAHQRMQEEARARELEEASSMTLARGVEDAMLEGAKRAVVREGDPMAMHARRRQRGEEDATMQSNPRTAAANGGGGRGGTAVASSQRRPVYKGPQPKPNRYGLRPGYRWDGIDRGNGFEDRVLEMLHSKGRKKEEAYKWSAADM